MMKYYDLIIIGGGVAGCEAAELAAGKGLSVLLVEKEKIGGTCLNSGCIPSKYLLTIAHELECYKKKKEIFKGNITLDFTSLIKQQQIAVQSLSDGMKNSLKILDVEIIKGQADIKKLNNEIIVAVEGNEFSAKDIIIATGSEAAIPEIKGIQDEIKNGFVCTNSNLFRLEDLPESIVIVGGGVSGIEMAYAFKAFNCNVTVIEVTDRIIRGFDYEISLDIEKIFVSKGIKIIHSGVITDICEGCVCVSTGNDDLVIECDTVYMCSGRKINCMQMLNGLIPLNEKMFIKTDENFLTEVEHVYAIGDVNGKSLLAHSAIYQAQIAVNNICGIKNEHRQEIVPQIIYISPECCQIGENEESARAKGLYFETASISMNYSGRYVATHGKMSNEGKIKLLIDQQERIIGASIISYYASEVVMTLNLLISMHIPCDEIMQYIFAHPTEGEIIRKCISLYKRNKSNSIAH